MATRKKSEKKIVEDVRASAHKIWLAGLGAVSMAEEEGSRAFRNLVSRGEGMEVRGKQTVSTVKKRAGDAWSSVEEGFEQRLVRALKRLGVPTAADLDEVRRRLDRLEGKGSSRRKTASRRAAPGKKPTTRKAPARKAATSRKKTGKA